jgi:hypothetical protein
MISSDIAQFYQSGVLSAYPVDRYSAWDELQAKAARPFALLFANGVSLLTVSSIPQLLGGTAFHSRCDCE